MSLQVAAIRLLIAKFHYTGPTGPARTRKDFFAARVSEKLRWVRAGPRGSGRARVVEFSLYHTIAEWLACWTQVLKDPGSNRSRDAVG